MNPVSIASPKHLLPAMASLGLGLFTCSVQADFVGDSKARIEMRNHYINRDFRQANAAQSKAEEWAQGFTARIESGYTEGTLGFGLDALGELGLKLDSSPDRRGTGLLPFGPNSHEPADEFSELGLTGKLRLSKSVLKIGTLQPGTDADFLVLDYNATPLLSYRLKQANNIAETLFVLMTLGDDRTVLQTYAAGSLVHQR